MWVQVRILADCTRIKANPVICQCGVEKVAQMEEVSGEYLASDFSQNRPLEVNTYPKLIQVVQNSMHKTMLVGEEHHGPGQWMKQTRDFHINRALKHLADFILNDDVEDLEHALCRLGMAKYQDFRQD